MKVTNSLRVRRDITFGRDVMIWEGREEAALAADSGLHLGAGSKDAFTEVNHPKLLTYDLMTYVHLTFQWKLR